MNQFSFERLEAYKQAVQLVRKVYKLTENFPQSERYALCSQLRRSVVSVPSNLAEGSGRVSVKEKIHFLEIAFGSLLESYCQLEIAVQLEYITTQDFEAIKEDYFSVSSLINGLKQSFDKKLQQQGS